MAPDSSFVFLRRATEAEEYLDFACQKRVLITVGSLTLRSRTPLQPSQVERALHHLFRKVAPLRLCFRRRGGVLWVCDMNREQVDFEVWQREDVVGAMEELSRYPFPTSEGPVWCARLLPDSATAACSRPDLRHAFPHACSLLVANHHGIADGFTNMFAVKALLQALDAVVDGGAVSDAQVGLFAADDATAAIVQARRHELEQDAPLLHRLKQEMDEVISSTKLIPRLHPLPAAADPHPTSRIVVRGLDQPATRRLIARCKQEGVTVNSAVVAAINVSFADMARSAGLQQDQYRLAATHSVDMRRHWPGDTSGSLGYHVLVILEQSTVPAAWREQFWQYARTTHGELRRAIQDSQVATFYVLSIEEGAIEGYFTERPPPETDYGVANMGDLDRYVPSQARHVHLTHMQVVTSCWNDPLHVQYHTLHGCFSLSLTHASDLLTQHHAHALADTILANLEAVTRL